MSSGIHKRDSRRRRLGCIAAAGLAILVLSSCTKHREEPYIDLEEAYVSGPNGRLELETATERSKGRVSRWTLHMWVRNERMQLQFHPLAITGKLFVTRPNGPSGPSFEALEIVYQLNDRAEVLLEALEIKQSDPTWDSNSVRLEFAQPENLANLFFAPDFSRPLDWIERVEAMRGDVHRFRIRFMHNGEQFVLEASFKIKVDTVWYSGGSFGGLP